MLAVIVLGSTWWVVSSLSAPQDRVALERAHNAKVLEQAKRALIGYVANEAAQSGENNPGHIPCPEALANIGTADEGKEATYCAASGAGRLPWRSLGIDQLRDASGEPLWLVVADGWRRLNSGTPTVINSDCDVDDPLSTRTCVTGRLTVDSVPRAAVAVIIAPGRPFQVQADAVNVNCSGFAQTRAGIPVATPRNYLECQNGAAGTSYVTSGPSGSFNDQVLAISAAEILPAIEAAVAWRFEKQIAPQLRAVYTNSELAVPNLSWPTTNTVLPFAAPLANPTTSSLKGTRTTAGVTTTGTFQGLLPLNRVRSACTCAPAAACECTPAACTAGSDCDPNFIAWTGATLTGPNIYSPNCTVTSALLTCTFHVRVGLLGFLGLTPPPPSFDFTLTATAQNVGMGLRQFQTQAPMPGVLASGRTLTGSLAANGSANVTLAARADTSDLGGLSLFDLVGALLCDVTGILGLTVGCAQDSFSVPISVFVDHPLTNENDATYGWFKRNRWHEVSYYAMAPTVAPSGTGGCTTGTTCLTVNYRSPSDTYRSLLVFAGRPLPAVSPVQVRPATTLDDLFEGDNRSVGNATPLAPFTVRDPSSTVNRTFSDRIAVIGKNP